jgi:hypothetical protein
VTAVNWAGNVAYGAERVQVPTSIAELCALIAAAPRIRVLGSRHSFNAIADSDQLVSLHGLPSQVEVDRRTSTVTCSGAISYGELAVTLAAEGLALANLGSLPHISVAGSVATATHGSGDRLGNLATSVAALEFVTSAGEVVHASRGEQDFDGLVVGLGALGAVTRVTLDVEPAYAVSQVVYEGLSWQALDQHFDELTGAGDSVSVFTRWRSRPASCGSSAGPTGSSPPHASCSEPARPPGRCTRSRVATRPPVPRNWACRGHGMTACRTSGWSSHRAPVKSSSPNTSYPAPTRAPRSKRSAGSPRGSERCCMSARSEPSPPTDSG